jgi:hypothetical protein
MPRSKRRKGVRADKNKAATQKRRGFIDAGQPNRYYDPGKKPRPRNMVKAATPRHDHRRGGS